MSIFRHVSKYHLQTITRNMSTSIAQKIKVEMVSDAICKPLRTHIHVPFTARPDVRYISGPFCYIGYKNYDQGVALAKKNQLNLDFDLEFKPFLLDPTLGKDPVVKRDRYAQKFGGKERVAAMEQQMIQRGKDVGINL